MQTDVRGHRRESDTSSANSREDPIINETEQSEDTSKDERPSLMVRKFLAHAAAMEQDPERQEREREEALERARLDLEDAERQRAGKELYFFYGSLMDPTVLREVLNFKETPELKPAQIIGFQVKMWGPYPALLLGEIGQVARGMACEIEGAKNKERLAIYETNNYDERRVLIDIDGEEGPFDGSFLGTAFEWVGNQDELKEGSFDVKDWQMRRVESEG